MANDVRYDELAALSKPTACSFAEQMGLEFVYKHHNEPVEFPNALKVQYALAELEQGREFVVYADTDIKFARNAMPKDFLQQFSTFPLAMSTDEGGLCVGFFIARNCPDILRLFRVWAALGYSDLPLMEQGTFKVMVENFSWVRRLIGEIPQTLVSNPACPRQGSIAHHFWARGTNRNDVIRAMGG